jgi:hypothetical protein
MELGLRSVGRSEVLVLGISESGNAGGEGKEEYDSFLRSCCFWSFGLLDELLIISVASGPNNINHFDGFYDLGLSTFCL